MSILNDIFELIITKKFDPYKNYTKNFVFIDMIYIRILGTTYYDQNKFITLINNYLNLSHFDDKINKFIYLTSK